MAVKATPEGYHSVTAYLNVRGAARAIEYYKKAFGAEEAFRLPMPDGTIGHAEVRIGDTIVMLADEAPEWGNMSPESLGGTASGLMLYVEDVDAVFKRALEAGGKEVRAVQNEFYGDRAGTILDPFGHKWMIATHVEDLSEEEMQKRMDEWMASQGT